jgi:hypothetical protein
MLTACMNPLDLTVNQLKRAAAIKEQIEDLNKELGRILGRAGRSGTVTRKKRGMSTVGRRNIAAAQRARWAKIQSKQSANSTPKSAAPAQKRTMSRATKAKLAAKLRAYWKAKKAGNR